MCVMVVISVMSVTGAEISCKILENGWIGKVMG